jgi:hypothetical protein
MKAQKTKIGLLPVMWRVINNRKNYAIEVSNRITDADAVT